MPLWLKVTGAILNTLSAAVTIGVIFCGITGFVMWNTGVIRVLHATEHVWVVSIY